MRQKTKDIRCEVHTHFGNSLCLPGLQKKILAHFHDFCVQNKAFCCEVQTHFQSSPCRVCRKSPGHIFLIDVSKNEAFAVKIRRSFDVFTLQSYQNVLGVLQSCLF